MSFQVAYRLLEGFEEFEACHALQKEIFNFPDKYAISPAIINLLNRKYPNIGYALGAFSDNKLIGYLLSTSTTENNCIYAIMLGVSKAYQGHNIGLELFLKQKQMCIENKIEKLYFIYDPLEGNLGNLYIHKLGMVGLKYEPAVYHLDNETIPNDKVLVCWDFKSLKKDRTNDTMLPNIKQIKHLKYPFNDHRFDDLPDSDQVLIQIPENFIKLSNENNKDALQWRLKTRQIFSHYINEKNYTLNNFYSIANNKSRENYYLLRKQFT